MKSRQCSEPGNDKTGMLDRISASPGKSRKQPSLVAGEDRNVPTGRLDFIRGHMHPLPHHTQYESELRISPIARVTRPTIVNGLIDSLMKWTEPSANRRFAPPGWNE
jgi:hypothetical protein